MTAQELVEELNLLIAAGLPADHIIEVDDMEGVVQILGPLDGDGGREILHEISVA